jgi:hypothetical protein
VLLATKDFFESTGAIVFFMFVLVMGYVVCFALWWFVFRTPRQERKPPASGPGAPPEE